MFSHSILGKDQKAFRHTYCYKLRLLSVKLTDEVMFSNVNSEIPANIYHCIKIVERETPLIRLSEKLI